MRFMRCAVTAATFLDIMQTMFAFAVTQAKVGTLAATAISLLHPFKVGSCVDEGQQALTVQ